MKLDTEIILVIEQDLEQGKETNFILKNTRENMDMLSRYGIATSFITPVDMNLVGKNYLAKICTDIKELAEFYNGKYNVYDDYSLRIDKKDNYVCSMLKTCLRPHYERLELNNVRIGDIIHNTNGSDYKIIDIFDKKDSSMDALLININTFEIVAAHKLSCYYVIYGDVNNDGALSMNGYYEWGHGIYYGSINKETNMRSIYLDNLPNNFETQARDIYEHRQRVLREYVSTQQVIDDKRFDKTIRNAAKEVMANKFKSLDYDDFDKALMEGAFDDSFAHTKKKDKGGI